MGARDMYWEFDKAVKNTFAFDRILATYYPEADKVYKSQHKKDMYELYKKNAVERTDLGSDNSFMNFAIKFTKFLSDFSAYASSHSFDKHDGVVDR